MERNSAPGLSSDRPDAEPAFDKQFVYEVLAMIFVVQSRVVSLKAGW